MKKTYDPIDVNNDDKMVLEGERIPKLVISNNYKRKGFFLTEEQIKNLNKLGIKATDKTTEAEVLKILKKRKKFEAVVKLTDISSPKKWEPVIKQAPWSKN